MRVTGVEKVAGTLVLLEGLGVLALVGWQVVALLGGDTESTVSAIALIILSAVFAAAIIAFGASIARGISWGRSGGVVTQVLILAVALGAATGQFADASLALGLAVPALIILVLIVMATRAAASRRDQVS